MSLTNALPAEAARAAKEASHILAILPAASRNKALTAIHAALACGMMGFIMRMRLCLINKTELASS